MAKALNKTVLVLLVIVVFLAWSDGRGSAADFANDVGRITGDVASAVVEFFDGLSENKPGTDA